MIYPVLIFYLTSFVFSMAWWEQQAKDLNGPVLVGHVILAVFMSLIPFGNTGFALCSLGPVLERIFSIPFYKKDRK